MTVTIQATITISFFVLFTIFVGILTMMLLPFHFPLSVFEFFCPAAPNFHTTNALAPNRLGSEETARVRRGSSRRAGRSGKFPSAIETRARQTLSRARTCRQPSLDSNPRLTS